MLVLEWLSGGYASNPQSPGLKKCNYPSLDDFLGDELLKEKVLWLALCPSECRCDLPQRRVLVKSQINAAGRPRRARDGGDTRVVGGCGSRRCSRASHLIPFHTEMVESCFPLPRFTLSLRKSVPLALGAAGCQQEESVGRRAGPRSVSVASLDAAQLRASPLVSANERRFVC